METENILQKLKLTASLMELHDGNPFKIKAYQSAVFQLDKSGIELTGLSEKELESTEGIGKSLAGKILEIIRTGSFAELNELLAQTPDGVLEMLSIKGIGPKKIRVIWKELGITSKSDLAIACREGKVAALKGFGEKTQEQILEFLEFEESQKGRFFYADVEDLAFAIEAALVKSGFPGKLALSGEVRRKMETVGLLQLIAATANPQRAHWFLDGFNGLVKDTVKSGPFVWRGRLEFRGNQLQTEIKLVSPEKFGSALYKHSASMTHLNKTYKDNITLLRELNDTAFESEDSFFAFAGLPFIPAECREGIKELELAVNGRFPRLLEDADLKGIFHNHTKYSDGKNTLEEMAVACKDLGYEYLGISDHSKSATYANGLYEKNIIQQHQEIDKINQKLAPFKVFKGIESDILGDGSLDYEDDVLAGFDFIVASIHSNLKMDIEKATLRLVKAIENPYTTFLGHPTGRLLLRREGYPIDHQKVIDACADNGVIIEVNANPWRLDLDWRWIDYALTKGVMLSINPDAHEIAGYADMKYGVCVARKALLTREHTFNARSLHMVEAYLHTKKNAIRIK